MMPDIPSDFQPVSLTYSSLSLPSASDDQAPEEFYNPFPEMNDLAPDGSRSAFPRRAKHNLPLDSTFFPDCKWRYYDELTDADRESYPPALRDAILRDFQSTPHIARAFPRRPSQTNTLRLHHAFEIVHKRLASAEFKVTLRATAIVNLYDTIESTILKPKRKERIAVPLVAAKNGSALQRAASYVKDGFSTTLLLDETISLIGCIALFDFLDTKLDPVVMEKFWVDQENGEFRDFSAFYYPLRGRFQDLYPRSGFTHYLEFVIRCAKAMYSVWNGEPPDFPSSSGIAGQAQWMLAAATMVADGGRTFSDGGNWHNFVMFELQLESDQQAARVTVFPLKNLVDLIRKYWPSEGSGSI